MDRKTKQESNRFLEANVDQNEVKRFIMRYVAMWHEADPARRKEIVLDLWRNDAENVTSKFVVRGIDDILARVHRAHEEWVASKGYKFEPTGNTDSHHNLIKFFWQMVPKSGGPVAAKGLDIFVLGDDDRIQALYQFSEPVKQ